MKLLAIGLLLVGFKAHAGIMLRCESLEPKKQVMLDVTHVGTNRFRISTLVRDEQTGILINGSLNAVLDRKSGYLTGHGMIGGFPAVIQGPAIANSSGNIQLSIHSWDKRIDAGYGMDLNCTKI